ncbi:MAG: multicopper oxidase domain-containing protein, partial [Acidobacteriota bacterium]|nr:multicopper oxidase domain-containing protein [Acidobacteriota bacterium]
MTRATALRWMLALGTVAAAIVAAPNTHTHQQDATGDCAIAGRGAGPDTDLYCIELFHRPDFPDASGRAELGRVPSPFGTRVSTDGHHEFNVAFVIRGLPDPSSIGPYTTYVAWATTPLLRPMVNLGPVGNGRADLGRVGFDKFLILVTAEASADVDTYQGRLVLRGISASMRMEPEDLLQLTGIVGNQGAGEASDWPAPLPHPLVEMMPGVGDLRPAVTPYAPQTPTGGPAPSARPRDVVTLPDGGTLDLEAAVVTRTINGRTFTMFGFNGQYPGPLIRVPQDATITVNFTNRLDLPTAIHWHGIRLDNRYDGVPGVTQDPVQPGDSFRYRIHFPDAGIYWYHPHHREDIQQDLGLYGNMRVDARDPDYFGPANREAVLMLDDLLTTADGAALVPYGRERATHALMGRFGNLLLVNGEPEYRLAVERGAVVRFFLTNVSNTRTFNLSFGDEAIKLVASDVGKFERETWVDSVVIAPAERYIVEVRFPEAGTVALINGVQSIDHVYGNFFPEATALG